MYHILEWLSNSIFPADKKIPRLQADCPVKLYSLISDCQPCWHIEIPIHDSIVEHLTSFLSVIQPAGLSSSCGEFHYHLFNMALWSNFDLSIMLSNRLTSVCPFLTAFIQVSATQRGKPGYYGN